MTKDLREQIDDALEDRNDWEQRQTLWYNLRHGRVARTSKPYPGAPDMRFKLIDTLVEKLKPFYVQQLYGNETLASFICLKDQDSALTSGASYWFDYKLKQESNFEREVSIAIDIMLQSGFDVLKVFWDADAKRLSFDACDPLHIIVPEWTEEIQDADWLIHVLHYSEAQYRQKANFNQDDEFIKRIKGKGARDGSDYKEQSEGLREGINCGEDDEQIVLWECYYRDSTTASAGWRVETISPLLPYDCDERVIPSFGLPFKHGLLPFCKLRAEIIGKAYYSPRGIAEIAVTEQQYGSKMLNKKVEWLDFFGNPTYSSDQPIPNARNYKAAPGAILPAGLKPNVHPAPPVSFDEELNQTRSMAEWRVSMPDFGVTDSRPGSRPGTNRTATEVQAIVGQTSQGTDIRARVFRADIGDVLKMAWSVLLQYDSQSFTYIVTDQLEQLDKAALHEQYQIVPNGSPDSWNKGAQLQKAIGMVQMLANSPMAPYVKWGEAIKWLFEKDEPRDIKRLVADPQIQSQDQAEQQQIEIVQILNNFGCPIHESDDDKVHCAVGIQFFQGRMQENAPVSPQQAQAFLQHFRAHLQALSQKKDPAAAQVGHDMSPFMAILQQLATQPPSNVIPLQPPSAAGSPGAQASPALPQETAAASPSDPDKKAQIAVQAGNMMANLISKGVPITHGEINTIFQHLGLAPLPTDPIRAPEPQPSEAVG